jgi:TRAP transporter TAXI family solute receptor
MGKGKKLTFYALFRDSGWWVMGEIMKKAMAHEGFEVEISWNTRERRLTDVADGSIDFGIIEETALYWAFHGIAQDEGHAIGADLRAIANVSQVFWLPFAVTHETRLTSIEQIKERKFPLRILTSHATVPGGLGSYRDLPAFLTEKIFEAYGFTLEDIVRWGGKHWTRENGGTQAIREHNFDAILRRATSGYYPASRSWYDATMLNNMRFLPFAQNVLDELGKKYHVRPGFLPRNFYRGVDEKVPVFYFPYMTIYVSRHMDEELAFTAAKSLDAHPEYYLEVHYPTVYNPHTACQDMGVPFHPGAERYYRSRGYIK